MKKFNAVLSIITVTMFVIHTTAMAILMSGCIPFIPWFRPFGQAFVGVFSLHAFVTILIIFMNINDGKARKYYGVNWLTYAQRITAVLLLIFIHRHFGAYTTISADGTVVFTPKTIGLFTTEMLFMISACLHLFIAFPKAFITLGIVKDTKSLRYTEIAAIVLTAAALILSAIGLVTYFLFRV